MRYRLQADLRRRLVRRYATLPPAWHRQHPTGDLLSVVDADVELTWQAVRLLPDGDLRTATAPTGEANGLRER